MGDERPGDSVFTTVAFRNSTLLALSAHEKRLMHFAEIARCPPLELDTLNYSKLIEDKYLKYKDKN